MAFIFSRSFIGLVIVIFLVFASGFGACLFDSETIGSCSEKVLLGWESTFSAISDKMVASIISSFHSFVNGIQMPKVNLPKITR